MIIRQSGDEDLGAIMAIHESAFGHNNEALLTKELLTDPNAAPCLSLIAIMNNKPVGHIIFTRANIAGAPEDLNASILAQTAVAPEAQGQGLGDQLTRHGLRHLIDTKTDAVFVFGHPFYYPRFGFEPAEKRNLTAPYPVPDQHKYTWMVQELKLGALKNLQGQVSCADGRDISRYWGK